MQHGFSCLCSTTFNNEFVNLDSGPEASSWVHRNVIAESECSVGPSSPPQDLLSTVWATHQLDLCLPHNNYALKYRTNLNQVPLGVSRGWTFLTLQSCGTLLSCMSMLLWPAPLQEVQSTLAKSESWSVSNSPKREVDALLISGILNFAIQGIHSFKNRDINNNKHFNSTFFVPF